MLRFKITLQLQFNLRTDLYIARQRHDMGLCAIPKTSVA